VLHELPRLRDRTHVFRDRSHAGELLAGMLEAYSESGAAVLAIPAGGVPVAAPIARTLGLPLDVAVVSKITPPWNSEVGYGAVAFDGSVLLNEPLIDSLAIDPAEIRSGIDRTTRKVRRRAELFRQTSEAPDVAGRTAIVVDDGLASGFTMRAALRALRGAGARQLVVAVPTGSERSVAALLPEVEALYCANVRGGMRFAVAEAYEAWRDVDETEARRLLVQPGAPGQGRTRNTAEDDAT
jgi:predicted phosphoribosyltransferase